MLGNLFKFASGLAIGAAIGVGVGRLVAPKSGEELKGDMEAYWKNVVDAGKQAEADRRAELQAQFVDAKRF